MAGAAAEVDLARTDALLQQGGRLGFQVESSEEVAAYAERWREAGLKIVVGKSVAKEDKVWAYDPDGNEWEVFFE